MRWFLLSIMSLMLLTACDELVVEPTVDVPEGEEATVMRVVDGDTIDVLLDGRMETVRYVGINTPERDEPCFADAREANLALVEGKTVLLVRDVSNRDRFDRLLRYIYVDGVFVEEELVRQGFAEAVLYQPDNRHYDDLLALERQAAAAGLGCHATGIFDDGSDVR